MKVIIIKRNNYMKYLLALVVLLSAFMAVRDSGGSVVSAFTQQKELPIYCVDNKGNKVAITFDCAWGADDIPDILATLEKEKIQATFFVVGQWAGKFPGHIKQISEAGHDVANHSFSHFRMETLDFTMAKQEISKCGNEIYEITGNKTNLFRAPFGSYNNTVIRAARELGCYTIQWDVDSLDWKPGITQQEILNRIIQKTKSGSIILFHNDTPHTAKLLPTIISSLRDNGYDFLPVSKLILKENYIIDHEGRQKERN